jgi:hypothetical protein
MTSEDLRALELADQATEMARSLGNDYLLSVALADAGIARFRTDPAAAIELFDESAVIATDVGFAIRDHALLFKGIAHVSLREYAPGAQAFDAALAYQHATGAVYYQSIVLAAVAGLLARIGSTSTAIQLLGSLQRLRDNGQIIGAPRDLAMQQQLRDRLQDTLEPNTFAELWTAGRRLTLDDAVSLARAELTQVAA